jgi:GNAT superfamily N-acetyltransferase
VSDITIRPATASDQAALGRYGAALMRQHHALDSQRFISADHPEAGYGRFLVSQLHASESVVLVAERGGQVIGYAFGTLEPTSWMELRAACGVLQDVFVDERERGVGAGAMLVRAVIDWLEAHGAPRVVLMTAERNPTAQRLFERLGFRRTMIEMTREAGG